MVDVIVVGGGITGVCAALHARREGAKVLLLDPLRPGEAGQTSFGNGGILAAEGVVPIATPGIVLRALGMLLSRDGPLFLNWPALPALLPFLARMVAASRPARVQEISAALAALTLDTVAEHRRLARDTPAEAFIREGPFVFLYRRPADWEADRWGRELRRAHGLRERLLDRAALEARDPALGPAFRLGVAWDGHGWITDPGRHLAALFEGGLAEGVAYRPVRVRALGRGRVLLEGGEELAAGRIILAAGVWSGPLARSLGLALPLESERGYHLMLTGAQPLPPSPYLVVDRAFVATPMAEGLRLAGLDELGALGRPPRRAPLRLLERGLRQLYPQAGAGVRSVWSGHRPTLPDSLPALGPVPGAEEVICAFGSHHLGLTIGPKLGRLAAALALGAPVELDLTAYAPGRFSWRADRGRNEDERQR